MLNWRLRIHGDDVIKMQNPVTFPHMQRTRATMVVMMAFWLVCVAVAGEDSNLQGNGRISCGDQPCLKEFGGISDISDNDGLSAESGAGVVQNAWVTDGLVFLAQGDLMEMEDRDDFSQHRLHPPPFHSPVATCPAHGDHGDGSLRSTVRGRLLIHGSFLLSLRSTLLLI